MSPKKELFKKYNGLIFFFLFYTLCLSCVENNVTIPKNIILFIGDGMGPAQISVLKTVLGSPQMERFKTAGFITTHSADRYVTDSAAGATAMATGYKTYNGAISVDPDTNQLKTVIEYAHEIGKSSGIVATSTITHATPACFVAHVDSRKKQTVIAEQITTSNTNIIIGGGLAYFLPQTIDSSKREDDKDLFSELKKNYTVVETNKDFFQAKNTSNLVYLYASDSPGKASNRSLSLAQMTEKALQILSRNDKGFFLMVEGSQIDWGGHDNELDYILQEIRDFDGAIGVGLDFAEKNNETLVIVTADHETGGLVLLEGSINDKEITKASFSTTSHSGTMVPLFAYGPKSDVFGGIHDNTYIGKKLIEFQQK